MASEAKKQHRQVRRVKILGTLFFVSSVLLGLLGCAGIGGGIYMTVDQLRFVTPVIGTSLIYNSALVVTIGSGIAIITSFVGCFGRLLAARAILVTMMVLLIAVSLLQWSGASLAIVYRGWITDQFRNFMTNTLKNDYGVNTSRSASVTKSWDTAQQKWYCCGVEDHGWGVYRQSAWYEIQPGVPDGDKPIVPISCCVTNQYGKYVDIQKCQTFRIGPPWLQSGEFNEAIFYRGCYVAGKDQLYRVSGYCITIGLVIYFAAIALLVFTLYFMRATAQFN